jgi:amino acid transporter
VVGEMKDPQHTLPRVLNRSMAMIITLFVMANMAFYNTLSQETLENTNAVAIVS